MANIPIEKKGSNWWMWLLALLLLAGLIWLIAGALDGDEPELADVEAVTPVGTPEPVAATAGLTIGDILGNPAAYIGQTFPSTEVSVASVPTDRGFWIADEGDSLFAILVDQPAEVPVDIDPGQVLRVEQGTLRDRTALPEIPGEPLDQDTKTIAEQQPIFLVVDEQYIEILGTGPAPVQ